MCMLSGTVFCVQCTLFHLLDIASRGVIHSVVWVDVLVARYSLPPDGSVVANICQASCATLCAARTQTQTRTQ
jgi:hypothetical protein